MLLFLKNCVRRAVGEENTITETIEGLYRSKCGRH